jgi:2,5-diamino-6-(ribosylamino)-4(3H)-pyrimidinone 5'-phosphate reductase
LKVTLIGAVTICGRITPTGYDSPRDRRRLEEARERTGASIIGANTLRNDDPEMRGINGALNYNRFRAVITGSGDIPVADKKLFNHGPRPIVFSGSKKFNTLRERLQDKAEVVRLPEGPNGLSLQAALDFFAGRGVESVLIEGGARLNYAALAEGIVDEILLTVIPRVSGVRGAASLADGPHLLGKPFLELELLKTEPVPTGELFLHYRIKNTG